MNRTVIFLQTKTVGLISPALATAALLIAALALCMGLSASRADASNEISVSGLGFSSGYVKPSGEIVLKVTIANTSSYTITDTYAYVKFPSAFTLLAGSKDTNVGTLGPWQSTTVSWHLRAPTAEGKSTNEIEVFADGDSSNSGYVADLDNSWLSLHIDGVPPTITTRTKPRLFWSDDNLRFRIRADDIRPVDSGIGGYRYQRLVNGSWIEVSTKTSSSYTSTYRYTCPNGSTCTVRTVAFDRAGNESVSEAFTASVDTQAPILKVNATTRLRANKPLKVKYSSYDPGISGLSSVSFSQSYSRDLLATASSGTAVIRPRDRKRYGKKSFKPVLYAFDRAGNDTSKQFTVKLFKAKPKFKLRKAKLVSGKRKRGKKGKTLRFTVTTSKFADGRLKASIIRPKSWKRFKLSKQLKGKGKATFRFKIPRKGKRRIKIKFKFYGDKIYKKHQETRVLGCGKKRDAWCKKSGKKKKKKKKSSKSKK